MVLELPGGDSPDSDPVFVLCAARSGSTLLRFMLDAHPDLACPPETNVPSLCGQLATVWSLIEGAPLSANRGDEPALARFWADNAELIAAAEEQHPERCRRVRYEDLVEDPQAVADGIFEFLRVAPVPDITARMFASERERFGPADFKIWSTSRVSGESVGRGWDVPAGMIAPPELERVNALASRLGYVPVDNGWGTTGRPADLRADASGHTPGTAGGNMGDLAALAGERLTAGLARADAGFADRWRSCGAEPFRVVITPDTPRGDGGNGWLVNLAAGTLTLADEGDEDGADDGAEWEMVGAAAVWRQVLEDGINFSLAMRRNVLRYCDADSAGPVIAEMRAAMLADLLGLTSWDGPGQPVPTAGARP